MNIFTTDNEELQQLEEIYKNIMKRSKRKREEEKQPITIISDEEKQSLKIKLNLNDENNDGYYKKYLKYKNKYLKLKEKIN